MYNYGSQLVGWLAENGVRNEGLKNYFMSGASDLEKQGVADAFYGMARKGGRQEHQQDGESKQMHLIPITENDGSFCYIDRITGKVVVSYRKMPNGLFSYLGDEKWMGILGGRGMMSGIVTAMNDDDYFHEGQSAAKKH